MYNNKFDTSDLKPSSSASVENDIREIKSDVLNTQGKITRVNVTAKKGISEEDDGDTKIIKKTHPKLHLLIKKTPRSTTYGIQ